MKYHQFIEFRKHDHHFQVQTVPTNCLIVLLATNATSEHSFSTLRQIKFYLGSPIKQRNLNHLIILHYHQEMTDKLYLKCIANECILKVKPEDVSLLICVTIPGPTRAYALPSTNCQGPTINCQGPTIARSSLAWPDNYLRTGTLLLPV